MKTKPIKMSVNLPVSPKEAFELLTDSKKIKAWSGQAGKVEPKIGGKVKVFGDWASGKVLEYKLGKSLSYTWVVGDWEKPSVVKYKLTKTKTGTKVDLIHSDLPSDKEVKDHRDGWDEYFFGPMKAYLAK